MNENESGDGNKKAIPPETDRRDCKITKNIPKTGMNRKREAIKEGSGERKRRSATADGDSRSGSDDNIHTYIVGLGLDLVDKLKIIGHTDL